MLTERYGAPRPAGAGVQVYLRGENGAEESVEVDERLQMPLALIEKHDGVATLHVTMEYARQSDGSAVLIRKRSERPMGEKGSVVVEQSFTNLYLAR